ncbi:uncharacterized protein FFB20_10560 [Fusarium fujikuroi]|uniref:Uncharacterized protein n=1 Tax=Gibberella fujikuroi (strain CBS 195.34 / IMI 58289 / NRRL A-6831) TaxID=1279085 RepID=S0EEP9_GIBF5|nr:uncharacterized protein FFUJ_10184 [Fusarium fujikuroi IMI 58289]KLO81029.1 uncharacterized protein LW93_9277 [Fusarium fujikuroi]KLP05907.1 uncharacterized protein Y057_7397 [Fusarium fujikuroi]KLP23143.1 uncharacterized protein LW94_696 [Fusarium fujikuroi]CCT73145.1 uncharacterized protein FFUJ_10184 [Fusarium fujikuroi IMI 58289]SCN97995.1 uncharacterized protein FFB20_10560 [Fusarium fujikuroi]
MDPCHIMCQWPNCTVEASHWAHCTCPYQSPTDESSSTHASPNSVSHHDQEPTPPSPAAFEPPQSASALDQAVSFCCGGWPTHDNGVHTQMDYASPNLLIDFEPQDIQPGDQSPPTTSGQSSKSASPSRTDDQLVNKDTKGTRSAVEELEDQFPADIPCRMQVEQCEMEKHQQGMQWDLGSQKRGCFEGADEHNQG